MEGSLTHTIERATDTFVAPGWHAINHRATSDAQMFEMSDEPLLRFANYYRFEAMD